MSATVEIVGDSEPQVIIDAEGNEMIVLTSPLPHNDRPASEVPTNIDILNKGTDVPPMTLTESEGAFAAADQEPEPSAGGEMTYLDMNEFMDILYKCKFCPFTASSPEDMSNHVLKLHVDCNMAVPQSKDSELIKTEFPKEQEARSASVVEDHMYNASIDKIDPVKGQDALIQTEEQAKEMTVDGECTEIFMCGQCPDTSFPTMALCKDHMAEVHNINVVESELETEAEVSDSISATVVNPDRDKVSIATQAMLSKKAGRKPKPKPTPEGTPSQDTDLTNIKLEPVDDGSEEMAIFSEEFLKERAREGKRRIKVPRQLQGTYYANRLTKLQASTPKNVKKEPTAQKQNKVKAAENPSLKCPQPTCKAHFLTEKTSEEHKKCHRFSEDGALLKGLKCPYCKFTAMQWNAMRLHFWTDHEMDLDLLKCEQCEFHTDAEHKLEAHRGLHDSDRRYACENCDLAFGKLSELLAHNDSEHKKNLRWFKNRQCPICQRVLSSTKCLKKHIQYVHEKVKAYQCEFCGHSAARKHMLQVHMRTHTGERPHQCDLCSFNTSDHNTLRRHRLRHTGEKPYKCNHCGYSCIQAISLKIHMKNKHGDQPGGMYYCELCHYHTVNEAYWAQHRRDHASGLIEEQQNQKYLPRGAEGAESGNAAKRQKTSHISLKTALKELRIPSSTVAVEPAAVTTATVPDLSSTVLQEVHEISEVVQGDEAGILTLGSAPQNIQYVYLAQQPGDDLSIPTTFLIKGLSNQLVASDAAAHTLTIQPDERGNPRIVEAESPGVSREFVVEPDGSAESSLVQTVEGIGKPAPGILVLESLEAVQSGLSGESVQLPVETVQAGLPIETVQLPVETVQAGLPIETVQLPVETVQAGLPIETVQLPVETSSVEVINVKPDTM